MLVKVNLQEIMDFMKEERDCKIEIDADGKASVLPIDAAGYDDTMLVQELYASDYDECGSDEAYTDWLEECYYGVELEGKNEKLVKIEFVK